MRMICYCALFGATAWLAGCHLEDGDRCDDGQVYDDAANACIPTDTDSDTATDSDTLAADAGSDGGTGMMSPCDGPEDCAEFVASYCLDISYGEIVLNGCVIAGCTVDPNDCPAPNTCCDLDPTYESMLSLPDTLCMPPEYWSQYSSFCVNG
jgi:hypothetical protein